eukprot:2150848-Pyramimonas_sp.AAC.1
MQTRIRSALGEAQLLERIPTSPPRCAALGHLPAPAARQPGQGQLGGPGRDARSVAVCPPHRR